VWSASEEEEGWEGWTVEFEDGGTTDLFDPAADSWQFRSTPDSCASLFRVEASIVTDNVRFSAAPLCALPDESFTPIFNKAKTSKKTGIISVSKSDRTRLAVAATSGTSLPHLPVEMATNVDQLQKRWGLGEPPRGP
jgi:hypothetical protein